MNHWLKLKSKKRRCLVPIECWPFGSRMYRWDSQYAACEKRKMWIFPMLPLLLCHSAEELDQTKQWTQRVGGEATRGEDSEGAVQEHEEQHRGREEAAGPHSRETPEGSECSQVCGSVTFSPPNPHQIFFFSFFWSCIYLISNLNNARPENVTSFLKKGKVSHFC